MSVAPDLPSVGVTSRRPGPGQAVVIPFPRPARPATAEIIPLPVRPTDPDAPRPDTDLDPGFVPDTDLDADSEAASQARRPPTGAPPVRGRRDEAAARPSRDRHPAGLRLPHATSTLAAARAARAGHPAGSASRAAEQPVRLTRRGRLVITAIATLAVAGLLTVLGARLGGGDPAPPPSSAAPAAVVVQPGDTLWSIARRVAPDRDTRQVVDDLRRLNELSSTDLDVGQRLLVHP
jgi:nucleoid-associated protein YgaU